MRFLQKYSHVWSFRWSKTKKNTYWSYACAKGLFLVKTRVSKAEICKGDYCGFLITELKTLTGEMTQQKLSSFDQGHFCEHDQNSVSVPYMTYHSKKTKKNKQINDIIYFHL